MISRDKWNQNPSGAKLIKHKRVHVYSIPKQNILNLDHKEECNVLCLYGRITEHILFMENWILILNIPLNFLNLKWDRISDSDLIYKITNRRLKHQSLVPSADLMHIYL